ncbi:hypothetical protein GOP47_0009934 [Adiantum capillus-veneris]|uniref:Protein N-lysine methyltransferase METTL21A n=1 Tax=Adiantum capillus-veneris TaxID=13818 RepID=A0A9D4UYD8_ADICA|nr:hypothetical protein GOP47_0009452 [Adiantum capillus-veneris]KAI5075858.1 hypothetical protein GOP47_0009934 [Adiantum capillus-veneris]
MTAEEDEVWLDESFFIDDSYVLKTFQYGSQIITLYCLQTSSTDYDLTGQIVWPGAELLNKYIARGLLSLNELAILELGSGVGLTGLLCGRYCKKIVMTDHNDKVLEVLQRNIDLQPSICDTNSHASTLLCEKLEWGNEQHLSNILEKHPEGFDLILGADICYQQDSLSSLFKTVKSLLSHESCRSKRFILSYVSRARSIDAALLREAKNFSLGVCEIAGTRASILGDILEGTLFEVQLL